jgi:hypothetical protein
VASGACGGSGCTPAGTCSSGTCSTASQTKDCSAQDEECKVGVCDPMSGACAATNKMNGVSCAVTDKCVLGPSCNGGACVGTAKICAPTGECRVAACNSATGDCDEMVAPVGSSCSSASACIQNPQCDATGNCVGGPLPDGAPCQLDGCVEAAACIAGSCVCLAVQDLGSTPSDLGVTQGDELDAGTESAPPSAGCQLGGDGSAGWLVMVLFALAVLRARARRSAV